MRTQFSTRSTSSFLNELVDLVGASVMSGTVSRVQSRIQNVCPKAVYTHFFAHSLNLVIVHVTREVADCLRFFEVESKLFNFFASSVVSAKMDCVKSR